MGSWTTEDFTGEAFDKQSAQAQPLLFHTLEDFLDLKFISRFQESSRGVFENLRDQMTREKILA
jgi:hypothetical protein